MTVKSRGITFIGEHVPLVLKDIKTVTRRTWGLEVVNQDPDAFEFVRMEGDLAAFRRLRDIGLTSIDIPLNSWPKKYEGRGLNTLYFFKCPYGAVGDGLYLKETWWVNMLQPNGKPFPDWLAPTYIIYKADCTERPFDEILREPIKWRSPRFMPKWASRKDMVIKELGPGRLWDITWRDCVNEGIKAILNKDVDLTESDVICAYSTLWDSINAKRGYPWEGNWWTWRIGW